MKVNKGISSFCIVLALLFFLSLAAINPIVIESIFGNLHDYYIDNIYQVQIWISALGLVLFCCGILGYKKEIFNFANRKEKIGGLLITIIFVFSSLFYIEFILRIKPEQTTEELYNSSVPYENAMFARTRFPQKQTNVAYPYLTDKTMYKLNQGYHSPSFSYEKPKDEIRIVVMGGSFIFGDQSKLSWEAIENQYNRNWVANCQQKLAKKGYENVRLINAGIPGHTSFDSFGRLYSEIHLFNPDYIIFCHGWNDIEYFSEVKPNNSLYRQMTPEKIKSKNEVTDPLEISQIYLRIKRKFQFEGLGVEGIKHLPQEGLTITPEAVKQFNLTLDLFVHACKLIDAQPILLTQPRLIHENNSSNEREKILYSFQRLNHDKICEAYSIIDSCILNYPSKDSTVISHHFAKPFIGIDSLYVDHLHLNSIGNEIISSSLASYLEKVIPLNN